MLTLSPGDAVEYHVLFGAWPRGYRPAPDAIAGVEMREGPVMNSPIDSILEM